MRQFIKILLIIIVISLFFWLINAKFLGNSSNVENLIEEQDRVSNNAQPIEAPTTAEQIPVSTESQTNVEDKTSQMITIAPLVDDSGLQHILPDTEALEQDLGGIDHILTPEERETMREFAPEAGDDGLIGEAPEMGDTGIYSDGPGSSDTIIGEGDILGTSLEDSSFETDMLVESQEDIDGIFGTSPENSQP